MSQLIEKMNFSFSFIYYEPIVRARKDNVDVIDISSSKSDIPTDKAYYKGLKKFYNKNNSYGDCKGFRALRCEFANYYNEKINTEKYSENNVQMALGASDAIISTLNAVCDKGDCIIILEPFFADYKNYCEMLGIIPYFQTKEEFIEKQIIPLRCKAVIFSNPNNPTGYIMTKKELDCIVEISKKNNLYMISDEVYSEIIYKNYISSAMYDYERIIIIDSISKKFNNCGARIGAIISKDKTLMTNVLKIYDSRISISNAEQFSTYKMFKKKKKIFNKNLKEFIRRKNKIVKYLENQELLKYKVPDGGSFIELTLPVKSTESFCIWLLEQYRNNRKTIFILPLKSFYKNCDNKIRITLTRKSDYIIEGLNLLVEAIKKYKEVYDEG